MRTVAAIVSALCILTSTAVPARAGEDSPSATRAAIEAANAKFSQVYATGDAAALGALYTSDAVLFPPGANTVQGSGPIGVFWKKSREGGVASAKLSTTNVEQSGDVAVEDGTVELVIKAEGKPDSTAKAKYLVVWKKQPDGGWKMHRDIWNDLPAGK